MACDYDEYMEEKASLSEATSKNTENNSPFKSIGLGD
jgi:hypothetical protein